MSDWADLVFAGARAIRRHLPVLLGGDAEAVDATLQALLERARAGEKVHNNIQRLLARHEQTRNWFREFLEAKRRLNRVVILLNALRSVRDEIEELAGPQWSALRDGLLHKLQLLTEVEDEWQAHQALEELLRDDPANPANELIRNVARHVIDQDSVMATYRGGEISLALTAEALGREVTPEAFPQLSITPVDDLDLSDVVNHSKRLAAELRTTIKIAGYREPPSRYANFHFYYEESAGSRGDRLKQGQVLKVGSWYQLEVAVTESRAGVPSRGDQFPIREPKQQCAAELIVTAHSDGFEIEEPVQTLTLPPLGDSTKNGYFRVKPLRQSQGLQDLLGLRIRVYYELNLLEVVSIKAEVVGPLDDDESSLTELDKPISFIQERLENRYADLDEILPRTLHIDITKQDGGYFFNVIFNRREGKHRKVEFPAPVRLSPTDLESLITEARRAMCGIAMTEVYGRQLSEDDEVEFARQIHRLARIGSNLWTRLFRLDRTSAMWVIGEFLRTHRLPVGSPFQVSVDKSASSFVFPWNLMFDADLPDDRDVLPPLQGFWGLRYAIEQRLPEMLVDSDAALGGGNPCEIGFLLWPFAQAPEQIRLLKGLTERSRVRIYNDEPIRDTVSAQRYFANCQSQIIYFFTHGHTRLQNTDVGVLRADELLSLYEKLIADPSLGEDSRSALTNIVAELKTRRYETDRTWIGLEYGNLYLDDLMRQTINLGERPLVFLNMCESAQVTPSLSEGFVRFFMNRGARVVVGTECSMRPIFAHHFSREFFGRVFEGVPVGQALVEVRQMFVDGRNPLGLAYTLFGSAMAKFSPSTTPDGVQSVAG